MAQPFVDAPLARHYAGQLGIIVAGGLLFWVWQAALGRPALGAIAAVMDAREVAANPGTAWAAGRFALGYLLLCLPFLIAAPLVVLGRRRAARFASTLPATRRSGNALLWMAALLLGATLLLYGTIAFMQLLSEGGWQAGPVWDAVRGAFRHSTAVSLGAGAGPVGDALFGALVTGLIAQVSWWLPDARQAAGGWVWGLTAAGTVIGYAAGVWPHLVP